MMKNAFDMKTLFTLFSILIVFCGCRNSIIDHPVPNQPNIKFIYPTEQDEAAYCCFEFEWNKVDEASGYQLRVFKDEALSDVIIDTIHTDTIFQLTEFLDLDTQYYCTITALDSGISDTISFFTKDYISPFVGEYITDITIRYWNMDLGFYKDSIYQGNLIVQKIDGNSFHIAESVSGRGTVYTFFDFFSEDESVIGFYNGFPLSVCTINHIDHTLHGYIGSSGVGNRIFWYFSVP